MTAFFVFACRSLLFVALSVAAAGHWIPTWLGMLGVGGVFENGRTTK